jgi:oligopeptide/dipeptide ABC transporter ATP-binding protein
MASIPRYGGGRARKRRLAEIPGIVPSLLEPIEGCAFAPRCPYAAERCRVEAPPLRQVGGGHVAACPFRGGGDGERSARSVTTLPLGTRKNPSPGTRRGSAS